MRKHRWKGGLVASGLAALCAAAMVLPAQPVFAAEENLALNKPVTASAEHQNLPASRLTDGNKDPKKGRWSAEQGPTQWAYVDLGASQEMNYFELTWESNTEYATDFNIYVSDSKDDWGEPDKAVKGNTSGVSTIKLDAPVTGQYVKLEVTKVSAYPNVSCSELEIKNISGEAPEKPAEATNLALKKPTKASKDYHNENGARAVDGKKKNSKADRWMTETKPTVDNPMWVYVDLGKSETVKHFELYWESAANYATDFNLYVSDSTTEWGEPVKAVKGNNQGQTSITLETPAMGRYVKLEITAESSGWGASCMEFEVWNEVPPAPEKQPADYLNDIEVKPVTAESTELEYTLPTDLPAGYKIKYNGTDYEQVIGLDGKIYRPISDVTVKASFKIENEKDKSDYAFKEFDVAVPGTMTAGANAAPRVLPELREWAGGEGQFAASAAKRVVYGSESLKAMAEEFASDYSVITGAGVKAVAGTSAVAGDIFFTLTDDASKGLGDEGYLLEAKADRIIVTAEEVAGANWGGKTILQGMKTGENSFPVGTTRDYPLYKVRGFILDVGRKTFTLDFLKQVTKQMSFYKMNDFQVHLNDNFIGLETLEEPMKAYSGFRLESDIKKGGNGGKNQADLTSTDVWYSKADFKEFIEHSKDLGVNIIPEIDTPAHSLALTKVRPDLRTGTSGRQNDHLDLKNQYAESIGFVQDIFNEYLDANADGTTAADDVFADADVIHIGADEYGAAPNAFRRFNNDMFKYVEDHDKTARVWGSLTSIAGDGSVKVPGISEDGQRRQINLWNFGYANIDKMYEDGFELIDCNDGDFYIVPNAGYYYDYLSYEHCYNDPLNAVNGIAIPAGDPQVAGGAFAVWNDMCYVSENGMSEYDIYDRIDGALGAFAANCWGKGSLSAADSQALYAKIGDAPNTNFGYEAAADENGMYAQWNMEGTLADSSDMNRDLENGKNAELAKVDGKQALKLNGGESYVSVKDDALTTLGLGNDLRVKVKRTSASTDEQVLFESEYGTIKAVQKDTGKVGITRENHDYSFNYTLPVDEWVELEFKNEFEVTTLYVNGEKVETVGATGNGSRNKLKATCMFPVNKIGSTENAFEGYVDDVRISTAGEFASTMELDYAVITAESVLAAQDVPGLRELLDQAYALFQRSNPAQADIDGLVTKIEALLTGEDGKPSYEMADYCRLDAYAQLQLDGDAAALLNGLFTEESVAGVQAAWAQVREDLPKSMQSTVDAYENAIVNALNDLELRTGGDLNFVDPASLKAVASSEQGGAEVAAKVLDGNVGTMWHSKYSENKLPISITLSSETPMSVDGFVYTPRQSGANGNMQAYDIEVSQDGKTFTKVASGTVKLDGVNPVSLKFDRQDNVKAVKIVWTKSVGNFASAAELRLMDAAAAPDFAGLQTLVDAAKAIKQDGSCKHDAFTDATWDALQAKIAEAEKVIADKSGDVNSVFALMGELGKSIVSLRLDAKVVDPGADEFTVTVDDRIPGHEDLVIVVKKGDKVPVLPMPEFAGYLFDGWYTDGVDGTWKSEWDFDAPVTTDLVLSAKWVENGDAPVDPGVDTPEPPVDPEKPTDPEKPVDPGKPNPGKPNADNPNPGKPGAGLPQTGDSSMLLIGGIAAAAVVLLVVGVIMRRRNSR